MPHFSDILNAVVQTNHTNIGHGLNSKPTTILQAQNQYQSRAILVTGMVAASVSLLAAIVALRWFILMERSFRHHLVLFLIASDTFKAIWYFVFPIVVFARGDIKSSSTWCQASGWFLAAAIEASDIAIFLIALHSIIYIFRPPHKAAEGGLYPYRYWIYPIWIGFPILAASLAFINENGAYATAGTFCYLPKRPFWYRLALAWIPRYLILMTIIGMYAAIYIYVNIKFKGFSNLGRDSSDSEPWAESRSASIFVARQSNTPLRQAELAATRSQSFSANLSQPNTLQQQEPWDTMSFVTSKPLQNTSRSRLESIAETDTFRKEDSITPEETPAVTPSDTRRTSRPVSWHPSANDLLDHSRKASDVHSTNLAYNRHASVSAMSGISAVSGKAPTMRSARTTDPMEATRLAIRRQLRQLFIYPAVYVLMWSVPFAAHCMVYSDYYSAHPVFGLSVVSTACLGLQAGVDCALFSWREKPWRRIDHNNRLSVSYWHRRGKALLGRAEQAQTLAPKQVDALPVQETKQEPKPVTHWWEVEARQRNDSVVSATQSSTQYSTAPSAFRQTNV